MHWLKLQVRNCETVSSSPTLRMKTGWVTLGKLLSLNPRKQKARESQNIAKKTADLCKQSPGVKNNSKVDILKKEDKRSQPQILGSSQSDLLFIEESFSYPPCLTI